MRVKNKEVVKHLHNTHKILVEEVKPAKIFIHFKYPKLFLLILFISAAYFLFSNPVISSFIAKLENLGYIGFFIAGLFFSFGFSAPFAVGFFITSNPSNLFLAALLGAIGGTLGNLVIFKSIRSSFLGELKALEDEKPIKALHEIVKNNLHIKMSVYLLYIFAGLIIASPLPNEIGVALLATIKHIKVKTLNILSFIFNGFGIIIILLLSR